MERERILIISHNYAPFLNPRAFRWAAICEHWAREGKKVEVVSSWRPDLKRFEIVNGVEVHRIGGGALERLRTLLRPQPRLSDTKNELTATTIQAGQIAKLFGWFLNAVKLFHDRIWKNIYWPDYACLWIGPAAAKSLELCEMGKYGTLVSVSDPTSSHLVGQIVKQRFAEINWIVDIGDPFCFRDETPVNNRRLYKSLNVRAEGRVLSRADAITVTCQPTADKYASLFAPQSHKIKVIPPLWSLKLYEKVQKSFFTKDNKFRILYVGTLYNSIRNPQFLLALFSKLVKIMPEVDFELHFVGGLHDCRHFFTPFSSLLDKSIFLHGAVEHRQASQAMQQAQLMVNIGNKNRYQLPSKIIEYACLGKPILNIANISDDSSSNYLSHYPAFLNLYNDGIMPKESDVLLLKQFIEGMPYHIDWTYLDRLREKFAVESIAHAYLNCIDNVKKCGKTDTPKKQAPKGATSV